MDVRTLPSGLTPSERCSERRKHVEGALGISLNLLQSDDAHIGSADEKNCEQMIGAVPLPVGVAGPLPIIFSSGEHAEVHLPLATTEGALVASVNRGCKAIAQAGGVTTAATHHGATRSIALKLSSARSAILEIIEAREEEWKAVGEATSEHLHILRYDIAQQEEYVFLTIAADTDEAMGMNMVTIAAQAIGEWFERHCDCTFVTVAGNVDSDKKPSRRTYELGRGYEVTAEALIPAEVVTSVLKTTPEALLEVAHAKLDVGSTIAGSIGRNLHAANIVAAIYLATGQDAAHVVEGSLTDTVVRSTQDAVSVRVRCPAILVGVLGGGTTLPAQHQCIELLLKKRTLRQSSVQAQLHPCQQFAESIGAAILAGELSLLAAQAAHHLAKTHVKYARSLR